MLPHNSLGRQMLKKLRVYAGEEHENMAQNLKFGNFNKGGYVKCLKQKQKNNVLWYRKKKKLYCKS